MSQILKSASTLRGAINAPGIASGLTSPFGINRFAPLYYAIHNALNGAVIVTSDNIDADITIEMFQGTEGARLEIDFYNMSFIRQEMFRALAESRTPIYVSLGYRGTGKTHKIGKFIILSADLGVDVEVERVGSFDVRFTIKGLEVAAWFCKFVNISLNSERLMPSKHFERVMELASHAEPKFDLKTVASDLVGAEPVLFESSYQTVYTVLNQLSDQFKYYVQTKDDTVYARPTRLGFGRSPDLNGRFNVIYFKPEYEFTAKSLPRVTVSGQQVSLVTQAKKVTGYSFAVVGNPLYSVLTTVLVKNVTFNPPLLAGASLLITALSHKFSSRKGEGYICEGRLAVVDPSEELELRHEIGHSGGNYGDLAGAIQDALDVKAETNKVVEIGEVSVVNDEDLKKRYIVTIASGMDIENNTLKSDRFSRNLAIYHTKEESSRSLITSDVTIASPYMGDGYGLFFPVTMESESKNKQRVVMVHNHKYNDPVVVGYILTNQMASSSDYPEHNAGDLLLSAQGGAKVLIATREDGDTPTSEVGCMAINVKSLEVHAGSSWLENQRPPLADEGDIVLAGKYASGEIKIFWDASASKIYLLRKPTGSGDDVVFVYDAVADTVTFYKSVTVSGAGLSAGTLSAGNGATGTFGTSVTVANGIVTNGVP